MKLKDTIIQIQDLEEQNTELIKENEELKARNDFLQRMCNGVKLNNSRLTQERNALVDELHSIKRMSMFEFADKYCDDNRLEEDGRAFARALLGGK